MEKKISPITTISLIISIIIILFALCFSCCSSDSSSTSHNSTTYNNDISYTCGYCFREMDDGYYDYINGKYACRWCSKELRGN